jgi:uncharacterized protein YaeQ
MALSSTMHNFEVALSDVDRDVYESLSIRVACHPSETEEYFATSTKKGFRFQRA